MMQSDTGKNKKIKVLQIAGGLRKNANNIAVSGGVPSFLNSYCNMVDKDKYTFDFMSLRNQCFEPYREQFENNSWKLYCLNLQADGMKRALQIIIELSKFLKKNDYDAVHINMGSFFPVLCCAIASKKAHVNTVIAHSHSSGIYSRKKRFAANLFSPLLTYFADEYCACSKKAAENLFSKKIIREKKYKVINNAIDAEKFKYDASTRIQIRKELGIRDADIVIGHVGRLVEVKNHEFLINAFKYLKEKDSNFKLILIGEGELRDKLEEQVSKEKLNDSVLFLGQRKDVYRYYQAMDLFIFPSTVEGLGITVIEAQAAGLPCYISSNVPEEVNITDLYHVFDLKNGARKLADQILDEKLYLYERENMTEKIINAGYNLKESIKIFEELYQV